MDEVNWGQKYDGDLTKTKEENITRLLFMNVGGLPFSNQHPKNIQICTMVQANQVDILGMAETNINWSELPFCHWLIERGLT